MQVNAYCNPDYWDKVHEATRKVRRGVVMRTVASLGGPVTAGMLLDHFLLPPGAQILGPLGAMPFVWNLPKTIGMVGAVWLNLKKANHNHRLMKSHKQLATPEAS